MTVSFESAIVPNWKGGRISFKNVRIQYNAPAQENKIAGQDPSVWDLRIDCINITLSLVRFLDGMKFEKSDLTKEFRKGYCEGLFHEGGQRNHR